MTLIHNKIYPTKKARKSIRRYGFPCTEKVDDNNLGRDWKGNLLVYEEKEIFDEKSNDIDENKGTNKR